MRLFYLNYDTTAAKRKDRGYDGDQDTHHKKSRTDVPATAIITITLASSDDVNRSTASSSVFNSPRSIATNKTAAAASSTSLIITRTWAREHDAALNHPVTPSNKLKHRLEAHQEQEPQDHDLEPWKRYKAQSKGQAPSTLSPSPTPSFIPSSSFALSQTSCRSSSRHRSSSSSSRSTLQLPKSSSSAPSAHPSPATFETKRALLKPTLMTLRSATRSLRSSTPQSSSPTPSTIAVSESVDTSSHGGDGSWVKVRETAETMIVTIQTRARKVTTKTRQDHKELAQKREVEQCISNQNQDVEPTKNSKECNSSDDGEAKEVDETETHDNIPEVVQPSQYNRVKKTVEIFQTQEVTEAKALQEGLSSEVNDQLKGCVDIKSVEIRRGKAARTEHEHPVTQNVDETEVDFELDIRGAQKRNNYPLRDRLPRVAGMPPPYQFRLRTLTRLVSSAKSTSGKSTEDLYSHHARLFNENVVEGQLDLNHPWAQGPVEFIMPRNMRHCHEGYRTSNNHLDHSQHLQDYDDYNNQYIPSTSSHSSIRNNDIYSPHSSSYNSLPATTPHMSPTDSLQPYTYLPATGGSVTESGSSRSRHSHSSTTARVGEINSALFFVNQVKRGRQSHHHSNSSDTADGCDNKSSNYSASPTHLQNSITKRFDTDENIPPSSYKAPIFDFPSKKRAEPVPLILSTNDRTARAFSMGTNTNTGNHHPLGPNVIEGIDIRFSVVHTPAGATCCEARRSQDPPWIQCTNSPLYHSPSINSQPTVAH